MSNATSQDALPAQLRRLDTPAAADLADLAAIFEDLRCVLRCCERLVVELAREDPDELALETCWTTALLSYGRCFGPRPSGTALTAEDVTALGLAGDVAGWHEVMLRMRDHFGDTTTNPREVFTIAFSQDKEGKASGIAVTSVRQPRVDDVTVRQTGAIAYELSRVVDQRILQKQQELFKGLVGLARVALERHPVIRFTAEDEGSSDS